MSWFNPEPGAINSIAGKRPLTNMTPLMLKHEGKPWLLVGAQGGRKIINCNTQLVLNAVDHHMGIQDAIAAPRIDASGRAVLVDSRINEQAVTQLESMGHKVRLVDESPAATPFAALWESCAMTRACSMVEPTRTVFRKRAVWSRNASSRATRRGAGSTPAPLRVCAAYKVRSRPSGSPLPSALPLACPGRVFRSPWRCRLRPCPPRARCQSGCS